MKKIICVFILIAMLTGCQSKHDTGEDFSSKYSKNFANTTNILAYLSIDIDRVTILSEINKSLIFCFLDDTVNVGNLKSPLYPQYIEKLITEGYRIVEDDVSSFEGTPVSKSIKVEKTDIELRITIIYDIEQFKKDKSFMKNIQKISNENVLIELTKK